MGGAKASGREQGGDKREGEIIRERGEAWGRESGGGEEPQAAMQEWRQAGRERRAKKGGRDGRRGGEAGIV